MINLNIDDYKKFSHWDDEVAYFVRKAKEIGIQGSDQLLLDFFRMVYKSGWDKKAIDEVIPRDKIIEEIDLRIGELIQEDGLNQDQVSQLIDYLEDNADKFRQTEENIMYSHNFIYNAVVDYRNRYIDSDIIVNIAEDIYYDFIKKNNIY